MVQRNGQTKTNKKEIFIHKKNSVIPSCHIIHLYRGSENSLQNKQTKKVRKYDLIWNMTQHTLAAFIQKKKKKFQFGVF